MKIATSVVMASAMSLGSSLAINDAFFEGPVLEKRQDAWKINGCYSSAGDLTKKGTDIYQSSGNCETVAKGNNNAKVIALINGDTCYYGNDLPPSSDKVDDSECNVPCHGYNKEMCGGSNAYLIWTNGDVQASAGGSSSSSQDDQQSAQASSSPSPSSTPAPAPTPVAVIVTTAQGGTTVVITGTPDSAAQATVSVTSTSNSDNNSGSSNKAPIAAGVVVGIVGLAAIVGGAFLFLRSRKQRQEAADLQRQNSSAGFASRAEKPPSTYSMSDSRLEPAFMRRMSDGSIADNQDYSRRILKVTNPDDR